MLAKRHSIFVFFRGTFRGRPVYIPTSDIFVTASRVWPVLLSPYQNILTGAELNFYYPPSQKLRLAPGHSQTSGPVNMVTTLL